MTTYWETCELCGKHKPVVECSIRGKKVNVCFTCAQLFGATLSCPRNWVLRQLGSLHPEKRLKEIEELLKLLE